MEKMKIVTSKKGEKLEKEDSKVSEINCNLLTSRTKRNMIEEEPSISEDLNRTRQNIDRMKEIENELEFLDKIKEVELGIEDERKSDELFSKLRLQDLTLTIFTIISMSSYVMYYENRTSETIKDFDDRRVIIPLWILTINNILFIIFNTSRHYLAMKLEKSCQEITSEESFYSTKKINICVFETLIILFSPNIYFHNIKHKTIHEGYMEVVEYEVNDLLCLFIFLRVYVIFRSLINLSKYYCARSLRVAKIMGVQLSRLFAVRCLLTVNPYSTLSITMTLVTFCIAYMLKIIEGPLYELLQKNQKDHNNYSNFENCIWTTLVTMTTVGYGDFYPSTNYGRFILIIAALIGTVLMSLIIITLQSKFSFNSFEDNAFNFFVRILEKEEIQKRAATFFKTSFELLHNKKKFVNHLKSERKDKKEYTNLKNNLTEALYKRIKHKKAFKSQFYNFRVSHEPFTIFDLIQDKIKEISTKVENMRNCTGESNGFINNQLNETEAKQLKLREDLIKIKEQILSEKESSLNEREKELKRVKTVNNDSEVKDIIIN